jgi:hypothetical protein
MHTFGMGLMKSGCGEGLQAVATRARGGVHLSIVSGGRSGLRYVIEVSPESGLAKLS